MKAWKLSASFISTFKACAYRCYAQYVLGIRPIAEPDPLRMGTNWHACLEILKQPTDVPCPLCTENGPDKECYYCSGTMKINEDPLDSVTAAMNLAYADKPASKTDEEWEAERQKIMVGLVAYRWFYQEDDYEVVAEEVPFSIPLRTPAGRALPGVVLVGKIDKITRSPEGVYYVDEHKSTSKDISSDSQYWSHLNLDTQTTLYPFAARTLQLEGKLEQYGIKATDPLISNVRYDAWRKPQIKPKKLTQGESKKFVEDGLYMDEEFIVTQFDDDKGSVYVNDVSAEVTPGAKEGTFAIRETAEMYGARLLKDIVTDPTKYFARKTVARTEADLQRLEAELTSIYRTVKFLDKGDHWWHNEQQCEATFKCQYINECYNNVELDPENPPEGFKCIYKKEKK